MSHEPEGQEKTASARRKISREKTRHKGRVNPSDRSHTSRIIIVIRKIKEMELPNSSDTTAKCVIKLIQAIAGLFVEIAKSGIVPSRSVARIQNLRVVMSFRAGLSKIPEASILVSILSVSESELVSADGIDS